MLFTTPYIGYSFLLSALYILLCGRHGEHVHLT
jgi:hypothetical protein